MRIQSRDLGSIRQWEQGETKSAHAEVRWAVPAPVQQSLLLAEDGTLNEYTSGVESVQVSGSLGISKDHSLQVSWHLQAELSIHTPIMVPSPGQRWLR